MRPLFILLCVIATLASLWRGAAPDGRPTETAAVAVASAAPTPAPVEAPKPRQAETDPFAVPFLPPAEPVRTGPRVELYVISARWCAPCRAAHAAAAGLTGVTFLDLDEQPREVVRINGELPPALPCFVRVVDGVAEERWIGATNRAGLISMRDGR